MSRHARHGRHPHPAAAARRTSHASPERDGGVPAPGVPVRAPQVQGSAEAALAGAAADAPVETSRPVVVPAPVPSLPTVDGPATDSAPGAVAVAAIPGPSAVAGLSAVPGTPASMISAPAATPETTAPVPAPLMPAFETRPAAGPPARSVSPGDTGPRDTGPRGGAPRDTGPGEAGLRDAGRREEGWDEPRPTCTVAQLRRFIKSRPWIPMHELRRRFGIYGGDDDVALIRVGGHVLFVGLPLAESRLMAELLSSGDVGYELSLDPVTPVVVGVYPMRPVPRG